MTTYDAELEDRMTIATDPAVEKARFDALVGIAQARRLLSHVPYMGEVPKIIAQLDRDLPLSGTPEARAVWDRVNEIEDGSA